MLDFRLTPNHAGLEIWGDRYAFVDLLDFVMRVTNESDFIEDDEGFIPALAYDFRKASQGERGVETRGSINDMPIPYVGVPLLWPAILVQTTMLRVAMAYMPTNRLDQGCMFLLEHVVERALREAAPMTAEIILERLRSAVAGSTYSHIEALWDSRCRYFVELPKAKRMKVLPRLIDSFDHFLVSLMHDGASRLPPGAIPPEDFEFENSEWPDFKW